MKVIISGYAYEDMKIEAESRAIPNTVKWDGEKFTFEIADEQTVEPELKE